MSAIRLIRRSPSEGAISAERFGYAQATSCRERTVRFDPLQTLARVVILAPMTMRWLNLVVVEAAWAAMAYFLGAGWFQRVFFFLLFNSLLLWSWRSSRATR
jgi:hypothetical protein